MRGIIGYAAFLPAGRLGRSQIAEFVGEMVSFVSIVGTEPGGGRSGVRG
jgi:hypothetical protein